MKLTVVGCSGSLSSPSTQIASAGHANAQSSHPMHFSSPFSWRFRRCRPVCARSGIGAMTFGYSSVLSGRNVCLKTVAIPFKTAPLSFQKRSRGPSRREASLIGSAPSGEVLAVPAG